MTRRLTPRRTLRPYSYFAQTEVRTPVTVEETTTALVEPDRALWPWVALMTVALIVVLGYFALQRDSAPTAVNPAPVASPTAVAPTIVVAPPVAPPVIVQPPPTVIVQQPPAPPAPSPAPSQS